jgi:arylsulfatase A-like enzyme
MNLILIAVDTLRADALSCYGNTDLTSPEIDRLASQGTLIENFYSVGNCTHPGFTAMLSGMFPERTGVVSHWTRVSPPQEIRMMAEYFDEGGFTTAAIDNLYDRWVPGHQYYPWFKRGFSHYSYPQPANRFQPASDVSRAACRWLRRSPREPFFLFVHFWDTHAPYNQAPEEFYRFYQGRDPCNPRLDFMPPSVREAQRKTFGRPITDPAFVVAAYEAETNYVDRCIGEIVEDAGKLDDETAIVLTSDHGEIMPPSRLALGRPWCFCHIGLSQGCLRLPFVAMVPGSQPVETGGNFQLVDVLPTLLDLAGVTKPSGLDGISFAGLFDGGSPKGRENLFFSENTYQRQRAVLSSGWKYSRMEKRYDSMPRRELYCLREDPSETINLCDLQEERSDRMDTLINEYVENTAGEVDPLRVQETTGRPY